MTATRLGDIIDDYCPRCRMLTNHSVAAIVGEEVRKVVCRTCQNSHDFKHGKGTGKKKLKQSAYEQVLASVLAGKNMEAPQKSAQPSRSSRTPTRSRLRPLTSSRNRPSRPR
ncbi:MAG: hypothetical protein HYX73_07885 [Acidobacteria bacterium]|nr:hypothetical protein [Acidobacteriota bacterium]